jgi:uncharacterized oxidoreductase
VQTTGNTILITGGGSGIGRGLAEAFHALGNQVIISGRGKKNLEATTAANPGMECLTVDMADAKSIQSFAARLEADYPTLNVIIHNAGTMSLEDVRTQSPELKEAEGMILTNLLGPMRLTAALLPLLLKQARAALVTVTSGLAFVPLTMTPTYCATKAALHSYTESLRYQLKGSKVEVIELIPPYVATTLMGEQQADDPRAMPLNDFIAEVMEIFKNEPHATEICVEKVLPLRLAADGGPEKYAQVFNGLNEAFAGGH